MVSDEIPATDNNSVATQAIPSPNIWQHTDVYEIENRSVDPERRIEAAMARVRAAQRGRTLADAFAGDRVLDIGCGTGFHLPRWAGVARTVVGVEPHPPLALAAGRRLTCTDDVAGEVSRVAVVMGGAQALPLADASADVSVARWAYFFGPGCEPGIAEVERVLAPGGTAFVIDNDATRSTFGQWFRWEWPSLDPAGIERFWRRQGFARAQVLMRWSMASRADFEAVVRIEFSPAVADRILAGHDGCEVDYAVNVWHRPNELRLA